MLRPRPLVATIALALAIAALASRPRSGATRLTPPLDERAERWVAETGMRLSIDEKIGQLIVPSFESSFLSTDSSGFDELLRLVRDYHVGGFHVFGVTERATPILLNPVSSGTAMLGEPFTVASVLNRLQQAATVPLLNSADFETGAGFRLSGATAFPRQMALGAVGDPALVRETARLTALEARAMGVQVNFAPVADVNNNPRNPVINTRSYGGDPGKVATLVAAYVDGAREGGVVATLKHFPGHGDTDIDSHLGLPVVAHTRERLDAIELVPFRAGLAHGAWAVMGAHIELPALDPGPATPATFSPFVIDRLLRRDLSFQGVVYTDSMSMDAVVKLVPPGEAAVRAILAGADQVLHSPDPVAAFEALRGAVSSKRIDRARLDESVDRILRLKAAAGLDRSRAVDLDALPASVGGRAHRAVADDAAVRSLTLIKDDRRHVPLTVSADDAVLYVSVLDNPWGWRIAAPGRTLVPELKKRWPKLTAIEVSDQTPAVELDIVRALAARHGTVVASVFVRTASGSGRMDLAPPLARLVNDIARAADRRGAPFVACLFGNPFVATVLPDVPAILLTYDWGDLPEAAAARALAGETAIHGTLPIELPGLFPIGHGLARVSRTDAPRRP